MKFKKYMITAMIVLAAFIASCQNETPAPPEPEQQTPEQQVPEENGILEITVEGVASCTWSLDGEKTGSTENGSIRLTGIRPGTHAISITSGDTSRVRIFTVGDGSIESGTSLFIDLSSERKEAGVLSATTVEGHLDKSDLYIPENVAMTNLILWTDGTATRKSPFGGDKRELAWKFDGNIAILADSTGRLYWGTRENGHIDMEIDNGWSYDIARHYRESIGSDIGIYGKWSLPSTAFSVLLPEALLGFINDFLSGVNFDIELDIGREMGGISLSAALCIDLSDAELTELPLNMIDYKLPIIPEARSKARVVIEMMSPIVLPPEKLAAFTAELSEDRKYMNVSFPFTGPGEQTIDTELLLLRKLPYETLRSWSDGADLGRPRYFKEDHELEFQHLLRAILKTKLSEGFLLEDYVIGKNRFLDKTDYLQGPAEQSDSNYEAEILIGKWEVYNEATETYMTWLFDGRMAFTVDNPPSGSNDVWVWHSPVDNLSTRPYPYIYRMAGDQTLENAANGFMFTDGDLPEIKQQSDGQYVCSWSVTELTDKVDEHLKPVPSDKTPIKFNARRVDDDKAEILIDRLAVQQGAYLRDMKYILGKDGIIMHPITERSEDPDELCRFDDPIEKKKLGILKPCGYAPFYLFMQDFLIQSDILPESMKESFGFTRSTYGVTPTEFGVLLETTPGAKIPLAWPDASGNVPEGTDMIEFPGLRISLIMPFSHEDSMEEYHEWIIPYTSTGEDVKIPLHDLGNAIN